MKRMTTGLVFTVDKIRGPVIEKIWNWNTNNATKTEISRKELIRLFNLTYFDELPKYIRFSSKKMIFSRIKNQNSYFVGILHEKMSEKKALYLWNSIQRLMKMTVNKEDFINQITKKFFNN